MDKGIIFYSNGIDEPIKIMVESTLEVGFPITKSYSNGNSYREMVLNIIGCLKQSKETYVFFCEHDVLYNPTHFEFTPPKDDTFYYNTNFWRWDYPKDRYITYDGLSSLSALCVNRLFALDHFEIRLKVIPQNDRLCRKMGYEPGTKKKKVGGFSDEEAKTWYSKKAIIDIRHEHTFTPRKINLVNFKRLPTGWKETNIRP
jgi:hypothetical protein